MPSASSQNNVDADAAFHTLSLVKKLVFQNSNNQASLLEQMDSSNLEAAVSKLLLEEEDENNLQQYLAPYLRQVVIEHLRNGQSEMVKKFRATYDETYKAGGIAVDLQSFLARQVQDKAWATDVEAAALGNLFNMTVIITPITRRVEQTSFIVNESSNKSAPIVQLYNSGNVHWYLDPSHPDKTISDGNCLYNAFALALRQSALFQSIVSDVVNKKTIPNISSGLKANFKRQQQLRDEVKQVEPLSMVGMMEKVIRFKIGLPKKAKKPVSPKRSPKSQLNSKEFPEYEKFIPVSWLDPAATKFYEEMQTLLNKAGELRIKSVNEPRYKPAAIAAHKLVVSLSNAANAYFNGDNTITPNEFIVFCTKRINKARVVLEKHRGWSQILGNLALAVVGVGVGYLVAGIIHKAVTGRFLFFRTESAEKLDQIQQAVINHKKHKPSI